ncbi:hypothetical protein [Aurantibacillus circumpalustris]|uniref:hypothetical protein n=1 Tax=Aurantibacillus circumpalustris TaxID=3036359 RepID=UPI00295AF658|nr:hypothetical protein [Aurantibacillus circumpalustris]
MKKINLKNWTLWRTTRLGLGIFFCITGGLKADYILMLGGVFLIIHALVNSCATCVTGNCEVPKETTNGKI